jgi:hypothetical protein
MLLSGRTDGVIKREVMYMMPINDNLVPVNCVQTGIYRPRFFGGRGASFYVDPFVAKPVGTQFIVQQLHGLVHFLGFNVFIGVFIAKNAATVLWIEWVIMISIFDFIFVDVVGIETAAFVAA